MRLLVLGGTQFVGRVAKAAADLLVKRVDRAAYVKRGGELAWLGARTRTWTQLPCWVPEHRELAGEMAGGGA